MEHVQSGKLDLSCIRVFVIDEADRMADAENTKVVMDVFERLPKVGWASEVWPRELGPGTLELDIFAV